MSVPALMLVYSAIDIAAGLAGADSEPSGRKGFAKWVNRYIAPQQTLSCSAVDLYGARCGLVHGFSPVSGLSQKQVAKRIVYALGDSEADKLRRVNSLGQMDYLVIHAGDLIKAVRTGVEAYLGEVAGNPILLKAVNRKAASVFGNVSDEYVDSLYELGKKMLGE
jgi:hypothetical protein